MSGPLDLTGVDEFTAGMSRYALLHRLPDGEVARWLVDSIPEMSAEHLRALAPSIGAISFVSPKATLRDASVRRAVNARTNSDDAEYVGQLLQLATSGKAVRRARNLQKDMTRGIKFTTTQRGYPETAYADLEVPASPTATFVARTWRGSVTPFTPTTMSSGERLERPSLKSTWPEVIRAHGGAAERMPLWVRMLVLTELSELMRRQLGDDPGAWDLAFELMGDGGASLGEAIDTAAATLVRTPVPATRGFSNIRWQMRSAIELTYGGRPLPGLDNMGELELEVVEKSPEATAR